MPDITFAPGTLITSEWLNQVNDYVNSTTVNDAVNIDVTPAGTLTSTNVQAALEELDADRQPLDTTLTALAGLTTGANKIPYSTGTDTFGQLDLSTNTSLGTSDTTVSTQKAVKTYADTKNIATQVAPSTSGNVLTSDGSTWVSSLPGSAGFMRAASMLIPKFCLYPGSGTSFQYLGFPTLTGTGTIAAVAQDGSLFDAYPGGVKATTVATANNMAGFFVNINVVGRNYTRALIRVKTLNTGGADWFVGFTSNTTIPAGTTNIFVPSSGYAGIGYDNSAGTFYVLAPSGVQTALSSVGIDTEDYLAEIVWDGGAGDVTGTLYEYNGALNSINPSTTVTVNGIGTVSVLNPLVWVRTEEAVAKSITLSEFYIETIQ